MWNELPLVSRIHRAVGCGFDAIEFHDEPLNEPDLVNLVTTLESVNLPVCSMNSYMGESYGTQAVNSLYDASGENLIWKTITVAKEIKAKGIHVTAGLASENHLPEHYIGALQYVLEHFDGDVYIEPLSNKVVPGYYLHSIEQAAAICEHFGNSRLKILFDCLHIRHEHENIVDVFKQHAHLIGHVQVSSFPARHEPDTGLLDYHLLIPLLFHAGYDGYIGCEYRPTTTVEEGLHWMDEIKELAA